MSSMMSSTTAEELGFTIDKTCYPWVAYKGPRFQPTEWYTMVTPAVSDLGARIPLDDKEWTTYKIANGDLVWGEYEWVSDLNFFEEVDEPATLLKETWVCVGREEIVVGARGPSCPNCGCDLTETTGVKVEDDSPPVFCSPECWAEDWASTLADRARDEAKQQ